MDGGDWVAAVLVTLAGIVTTGVFAVMHYEGLSRLDRWRFRASTASRPRDVVVAVLGLTVLHLVQIVGWGVLFWLAVQWPEAGAIDQERAVGVLEAIYVSGLNYSTLGLGGGLEPVGPVRVLVVMESLVGLMMIAWSANFTFHHLSVQLGHGRDGH
ncbi:MAG TPA: hypothetical protein VK911_14160 [Vicinamibacterales bacterium]|nr:hypothetical protein [Vicinamibacterales bacterium]